MPIEIRELHIKVTVNESGTPDNNRNSVSRSAEGAGNETAREELVAECIEQMVKIMENKRER
ncbi:conserved hypothetical protein [Chlorobaculum parvum NCIB 8327]|uniref:Uncharacterized protein n=1 Tax=Chlorobaculum parvum (strain DSM 263 / NCIMB 8327) TaxID=517417 RepID=B3QN08_CHLP8|nr:DUF5908 family protein [Chlorobaculum parvum]ACF11311.1 conserved hypothetical protein [Chlorobaculum parvum NCIB 8327]